MRYSLKLEGVDPLDGANVHERLALQRPGQMLTQQASTAVAAELSGQKPELGV